MLTKDKVTPLKPICKKIFIHYQPIISLVKKEIIGFEGLARGINLKDKSIINPIKMFAEAKLNGTTVELDRNCREISLKGFRSTYSTNKNLHLFINIDTSIFEIVEGSNYLYEQVVKYNISPENIVIEIKESKIKNIESLIRFVAKYRQYGFLIALDDVGYGFSNFERIGIVKPDIIKIDKSLVIGIDKGYYKQEIFKCLVNMANNIGAIVIAEGVETEEELFTVQEYGSHLIQGYFFSKPQLINNNSIEYVYNKIYKSADLYLENIKNKLKSEKLSKRALDSIMTIFINNIIESCEKDFNNILSFLTQKYCDNKIECVYILDKNGIQITDTIFKNEILNCKKGLIFYPAVVGADNSLNKYYYELINSRLNKYISEPYISHATGNVCVTVSRQFKDFEGNTFIICFDLKYISNNRFF